MKSRRARGARSGRGKEGDRKKKLWLPDIKR
jgi:ribosomal protein L15